MDARRFLMRMTGIDFLGIDFTDEREWFCVTVDDIDDGVIAVLVFEFKSTFDPFMTVAISHQRGLSRKLITAIARAVFSRAARISALIRTDDRVSASILDRIGFIAEGYVRRGYDGRKDAILYGLMPEECPYLAGRPRMRPIQPTHETAQGLQ